MSTNAQAYGKAKPGGNLARAQAANDRAFSALIEEYKILKSEATGTSEASGRAISYIQAYGFFIILLSGAYFSGLRIFLSTDLRSTLPPSLWLVTILSASVFLFLLYTNITHTSLKFLVLRERMSQIESKINKLIGSNILIYERRIAERSFGHTAVSISLISPNAWTRCFTSILFILAATIIVILSQYVFIQTSADYVLFVCGTVIFFTAVLVIDDIRINKFLNIDKLVQDHDQRPKSLTALVPYATNYIAFMIMFYALFAHAFASPSYSSAYASIDTLFEWMRSADRSIALFIIFIYDALCGALLFTPSELPLKLANDLGLAWVILFASIGKALGAGLLFVVSRWWLFRSMAGPARRVNQVATDLSTRFLRRSSLPVTYFLLQAIPFAPMRSATLAYAALGPGGVRSISVVMLGSALGTSSRMLLIWLAIGIIP